MAQSEAEAAHVRQYAGGVLEERKATFGLYVHDGGDGEQREAERTAAQGAEIAEPRHVSFDEYESAHFQRTGGERELLCLGSALPEKPVVAVDSRKAQVRILFDSRDEQSSRTAA